MANRPIGGVDECTVNGDPWSCVKSSWRKSNPKREGKSSQTHLDGFTEAPAFGHIELTVRAHPGQDVTELQNVTSATVTLKQKNGTTVYGYNMFQTGEAKTDTAEGTTDLVFEGVVTTSVAQ